jgi:hypothetical protein
MVHDPLSTALVAAFNVASHIGGAAVEKVEEDFVLLRAQGVCV